MWTWIKNSENLRVTGDSHIKFSFALGSPYSVAEAWGQISIRIVEIRKASRNVETAYL